MPSFFPPRPKQESIRTAICQETSSESNPFVAKKTLWHGYDAEKLIANYGWTEMLFLMSQGELPTPEQNQLLNKVMSFLANPGPRDAGVRAAMNCGVGKTPLPTILTTGLTVRGGMAEGAMHIEAAMRLLNGQFGLDQQRTSLPEHAAQLIHEYRMFWEEHKNDEVVPWPEIPPGFGLYYGERDSRAVTLINLLEDEGGNILNLALEIESVLSQENNPVYLTLSGVVAAALCELGFTPEHGAGVFMIAGSAGILAHGVEQLPRNWNEYPFWADSSYYNYEGPEPAKRVGAEE
ncbi:citryl-CoA lyase [Mariprofundus sp. KV]|uniref:citryl-CoA lyase n=1 Tax=Mariprofundus sp. KV TaxID=2608715 RepID=UPI0015A2D200|nr:citryl-CoA lyase [Mariprofundus sp. KV]NWF35679.1 citryl-CoA lyase [Mariprofundus sp. KV]